MVQARAVSKESSTDEPLFKRWRLSSEDFHRLVKAGVLNKTDRVELVQGELIEMAPIGSRHADVVSLLLNRLAKILPDGYRVWCQSPIRFDDYSELEPDVAVTVDGKYRDRLPGPQDVRLLIEVADSSLYYDRELKMPFYARHGIPELWLVDLTADAVEVYRRPGKDTYRLSLRPGLDETLAPEGMPEVTVALSELFA